MIYIKDNTFIFDLFYKLTFSGRYLSFYSNHPLIYKRGIIYNLVDKVIILSDPSFQGNNLDKSIRHLLKNGYPLNFIFKNINKNINN